MGFLAPLLPALGAAAPGIGAAAAPAAASAALPAAAAPALGGLSKLFNSRGMFDVSSAMMAANQPGQAQEMPQLPQQRPVRAFQDLLPQLMGEVGANYLGKLA